MNPLYQKIRFIFLFLLLVPGFSSAQVPADSSQHLHNAPEHQPFRPRKITGRSYILPATLVTYGIIATAIRENNKERPVIVPRSANAASLFLEPENYTALAPAAAVFGLQLTRVKGVHKPQEQALLFALSAGLSSAIVYPLKSNTGVLRPDQSDTHSFPSGHTALAFAAAEFLRREYGSRSGWYTVAGYAAATATAALRVGKDRHWLADVGTGAGIGIASTTTAYWIYNRLKKRETKSKGDACFFTPVVSRNHYALQLIKPL